MPALTLAESAAFGALHLATLAAWAVLAAALCVAGRRARRGPEAGLPGRWVLGGLALLFWSVHQVHSWGPGFDPSNSLPLHLCDLTTTSAWLAYLSRARVFRALLYFGALAFTVWGAATPLLGADQGLTDPDYWFFWFNHAGVLTLAAYDVVVGRFRPTLADAHRTALLALAYTALIQPLNQAYGWNYAYLGDVTPEGLGAFDRLPPWPLRIYALQTMGVVSIYGWWAVGALFRPKPG